MMSNEYNLFTVPKEEPKRLVSKYYANTLEHEVRNQLKLHLTKENAVKACDLSAMFRITERQLREVITNIRAKFNTKIIGDNNGYYIGTEEEFNEWFNGRMKRTMSSMKTTLDMNPDKINLLYWLLNKYDKQGILKGQKQLQFTGHEQEFIRQFAEDYFNE